MEESRDVVSGQSLFLEGSRKTLKLFHACEGAGENVGVVSRREVREVQLKAIADA
jgi:hypothetical protein